MKKLSTGTKSKIKTTVFWSGLASALLIFLQATAVLFGYELPEALIGQIMIAVNSFLALLTLGGVLVYTKDVESFQAMKRKAEPVKLMMTSRK